MAKQILPRLLRTRIETDIREMRRALSQIIPPDFLWSISILDDGQIGLTWDYQPKNPPASYQGEFTDSDLMLVLYYAQRIDWDDERRLAYEEEAFCAQLRFEHEKKLFLRRADEQITLDAPRQALAALPLPATG